jgi:PadR family transcriptional regulator PadR
LKDLTVLEQIILSAVWSLKDNAYGVSVRQKAKKLLGKNINYGTLYNALEQLLGKGYVTKNPGESDPERIGRPRIFYSLTPRGEKALWASYELHRTIWDSISDFVENFKP